MSCKSKNTPSHPSLPFNGGRISSRAQNGPTGGVGVPVDLIYRVSHNVPETMVQVMKEYRANFLVMGAPSGKGITSVLRGNFANRIAQNLPEGGQLLIYAWNNGGSG